MEFDDFIKSQQEEVSPENAGKQVEHFSRQIEEIYKIAREALEVYVDEGSAKLTIQKRDIFEELLSGVEEYYYQVDEMIIQIGRSRVTLTPIGINIIGAMGRIDMDGPLGKAVLLLTNSGGPKFKVQSPFDKLPASESPVVQPEEEQVWQFMIRTPKLHYVEVNVDTFKENLMKVISG